MKAEIQVLNGNGYVWDADVAHWLRRECGIVGAMVGGVAAFKQQNAVHGLPLELSAEEVTLAVEKGWGTLQSPLRMAELAVVLGGGGDGGRKRGREPSAYQYYDDDDVADQDADMADAQQQQPAAEPTWRAALAGSGGPFEIPTTPAEAAAANAGIDIAAAGKPTGSAVAGEPAAAEEGGAAGASGGAAGVEWAFPANNEEKHRYWVFRDLHSKGYRLTGGSKFGADYLLYPGDPTLYHAQFCVRLMPHAAPILPVMLSSATRGSHQARKHLLIASVTLEEEGGSGGGSAAAAGDAAGDAAGAGGAAAADGPEQQAAEQAQEAAAGSGQQQQEQQQGQLGGEGQQLGRSAGGVGACGERYRIHYLTIGPVEGFGG